MSVCRIAPSDPARLLCNATDLVALVTYTITLTVSTANPAASSAPVSLSVAKQPVPLPAVSLRAPSRVLRSARAVFASQLTQSVCASAALAAAAFSYQWSLTGPGIGLSTLSAVNVDTRGHDLAVPQGLLQVSVR